MLEQQEQLDFWTDDRIRIGDAWFKKIEDAINAASVAILLVSADFLVSPFIVREEIERLLKLPDQEGLVIFPILVGPCLCEESEMARTNATAAAWWSATLFRKDPLMRSI